jgi:hypothetical protein
MQEPSSPQTHSTSREEPVVEKWVWKLFTGEAYPYIRRTLQQQHGRSPTPAEIKEKFLEVYPRSTVKIMVMELVGLGLEFQDLASHPYGTADFSRLMADPIGHLSRIYGGGKFKLSFYDGDQFFATQNFKVAGQPQWNMRKCLLSVIDYMEEKDRGAQPPAASFAELRTRLCVKLGLSPDSTTEKAGFLQLIRLTAGNQYEDYLSILLNLPESSPLVGWFMAQLDALHARRSPPARR